MNPGMRHERSAPKATRGMTRLEVMVVLGVVGLLGVAWFPAFGRTGDDGERTVCQANMSGLVRALAMYALDNAEALPHPSWGSLSGDPGADNWCYATALGGPVQTRIPNAAARGGPFAHTNQLPFYVAGQLAPFAGGQQDFFCPQDWATAMADVRYQSWWTLREVKLTSYTMTGAVCGYGGRQDAQLDYGRTYKVTAFAPADRMFWEADETVPFNFNDAGSNPANPSEGVSERHGSNRDAGAPQYSDLAIVGRVDGRAEFVPWRSFDDLSSASISARPNELLCGPGYE